MCPRDNSSPLQRGRVHLTPDHLWCDCSQDNFQVHVQPSHHRPHLFELVPCIAGHRHVLRCCSLSDSGGRCLLLHVSALFFIQVSDVWLTRWDRQKGKIVLSEKHVLIRVLFLLSQYTTLQQLIDSGATHTWPHVICSTSNVGTWLHEASATCFKPASPTKSAGSR